MDRLLGIASCSDVSGRAEAERVAGMSDNGKTRLTPHELRLLKLILAGKSNQEIAAEVRIENGHTLRITISRIYRKLDIENPRQMLPRIEELRSIVEM